MSGLEIDGLNEFNAVMSRQEYKEAKAVILFLFLKNCPSCKKEGPAFTQGATVFASNHPSDNIKFLYADANQVRDFNARYGMT